MKFKKFQDNTPKCREKTFDLVHKLFQMQRKYKTNSLSGRGGVKIKAS